LELTKQQEEFCQEYARDGNATRSYKLAYKVRSDTKESTTNSNASRLLKDSKVIARLSELKKQLSKKKLWTREMSVITLANLANKKKKDGSLYHKPTEIIAAIKELNVMHGYNAATKLDHQSSDGTMSPKENNSDLITEALKAKYANK
jgi:phage terminase small subunit